VLPSARPGVVDLLYNELYKMYVQLAATSGFWFSGAKAPGVKTTSRRTCVTTGPIYPETALTAWTPRRFSKDYSGRVERQLGPDDTL